MTEPVHRVVVHGIVSEISITLGRFVLRCERGKTVDVQLRLDKRTLRILKLWQASRLEITLVGFYDVSRNWITDARMKRRNPLETLEGKVDG